MYKLLLSIILSIFSVCCLAQTSRIVRYYRDQNTSHEVVKEKASFSKTITITGDTISTEVKNIKTNTVWMSESYNGDEPIGVWIYGSGTKDYDFNVSYSDDTCSVNFPGLFIKNYFTDIDSIGYVAPKMNNGQTSFFSFIMNRIMYPEPAKRKGLEGTSIIFFTINTEGGIENITAQKGSTISFDKEAIRVIKLASFSSPATLNGKPQSICVKHRIKFRLS